jgi:hypothetical protein
MIDLIYAEGYSEIRYFKYCTPPNAIICLSFFQDGQNTDEQVTSLGLELPYSFWLISSTYYP